MADSIVGVMRQGYWDRIADELGKVFSVYAPKFLYVKIVSGRRVVTERFLLGRYFFVDKGEADLGVLYSRVVNHVGVRCVLNVDGVPLMASEQEVGRLRSYEVKGYVPDPEKFIYGERIRITVGALSGHEGRFDFYRKNAYMVRTDLLGREVEVEIPFGGIEHASCLAGNIAPI